MKEFQGEKLYIVSGDCDPPLVWVKMIKCTDNVKVRILKTLITYSRANSMSL